MAVRRKSTRCSCWRAAARRGACMPQPIGTRTVNTSSSPLWTSPRREKDLRSDDVRGNIPRAGRYAVPGMADRLFAVPWQALRLDTQNKRFTLDASKDQLKNAPGFDKDHWPAMADTSWASDVHKFYGVKTTGRVQQ